MLAITTRQNKKISVGAFFKSVCKKAHTLRVGILSAYVAVTLVALILMYFYTVVIVSQNLNSEKKMELFSKANIISQSTAGMWVSDESVMNLRIEDITDRLLAGTNIRGVVTNTSYTVLYDNNREANMTGKVFMRNVLKRAIDGEQDTSVFESDSGKTLTVAVPIVTGDEIIGGVYLAENLSSVTDTVATIKMSLIMFGLLILIIIIGISVGMSYLVTRPVMAFTEVARAISRGDFSMRAEERGSREIIEMGQALNFMCDELATLDMKRKNFVSDVSHELKTPMAGIKLLCDSLVKAENPDMDTIREFLTDMSMEIDRLTRLINRLLELSRLDSDASLNRSQVDMIALCKGVIKGLEKIAHENCIELKFKSDDEKLVTVADYDKMYECVYNVAVNAIKYTPQFGHVTATVKRDANNCVIEVEDDGPGIPDNEKNNIFERFYRLDDSRARDTGGTGLGLAITKEAILLHKGTIEGRDAEMGGSIIRITIPIINERNESV